MSVIKKLRLSAKAAALVEYVVLVGLIGVITIGAVLELGGEVEDGFNRTSTVLEDRLDLADGSATGGPGGSGGPGGGPGGGGPGGGGGAAGGFNDDFGFFSSDCVEILASPGDVYCAGDDNFTPFDNLDGDGTWDLESVVNRTIPGPFEHQICLWNVTLSEFVANDDGDFFCTGNRVARFVIRDETWIYRPEDQEAINLAGGFGSPGAAVYLLEYSVDPEDSLIIPATLGINPRPETHINYTGTPGQTCLYDPVIGEFIYNDYDLDNLDPDSEPMACDPTFP
jgi:Flp pilus assembly pilin Flp